MPEREKDKVCLYRCQLSMSASREEEDMLVPFSCQTDMMPVLLQPSWLLK